MSRTQSGAPSFTTRWLIDGLRARGVDCSHIHELLAMPSGAVDAELFSLSFSQYLKVFNWASEFLGEPFLGLLMAQELEQDAFGPGALVAYHMPTFREALSALTDNTCVITQGMQLKLDEGTQVSGVSYHILSSWGEIQRQDIDLSLVALTNIIRHYAGPAWQPERVDFVYREPDNSEPLRAFFGDALYFEQPDNRIIFESSLLDSSFDGADPVLLHFLREQLEVMRQGLLRHDDLIARVRFIIAAALGREHGMDSHAVASKLYMSRRTLVRNLARQETTFKEIRNGVIEELAKQALLRSSSSISDIALQLGFSEASAFDRSFKRLTGYTPRAYRQACGL